MPTSKTFAEIAIGDEASFSRVCREDDFIVFAHASGNMNPLHLTEAHDHPGQQHSVAPGMWIGSLFSALLGNVLPGMGTLYKSQSLRFHGRAHIGDELTVTVRVIEKQPEQRIVVLDTRVVNQAGQLITEGVAEVVAPEQAISVAVTQLPSLLLKRHQHFDRLIEAAASLDPMPTAVVCPEEENALGGRPGWLGLMG